MQNAKLNCGDNSKSEGGRRTVYGVSSPIWTDCYYERDVESGKSFQMGVICTFPDPVVYNLVLIHFSHEMFRTYGNIFTARIDDSILMICSVSRLLQLKLGIEIESSFTEDKDEIPEIVSQCVYEAFSEWIKEIEHAIKRWITTDVRFLECKDDMGIMNRCNNILASKSEEFLDNRTAEILGTIREGIKNMGGITELVDALGKITVALRERELEFKVASEQIGQIEDLESLQLKYPMFFKDRKIFKVELRPDDDGNRIELLERNEYYVKELHAGEMQW